MSAIEEVRSGRATPAVARGARPRSHHAGRTGRPGCIPRQGLRATHCRRKSTLGRRHWPDHTAILLSRRCGQVY